MRCSEKMNLSHREADRLVDRLIKHEFLRSSETRKSSFVRLDGKRYKVSVRTPTTGGFVVVEETRKPYSKKRSTYDTFIYLTTGYGPKYTFDDLDEYLPESEV